jgi:hypothetical protein
MFAADTVYVVEHKLLFVSVPVVYTWPMSIAFGIICQLKSHQNNFELDKQTLINNSRPKNKSPNFSFCFRSRIVATKQNCHHLCSSKKPLQSLSQTYGKCQDLGLRHLL